MPTDRVVGLDIGTSHIRAVVADFDAGRLAKIVGIGECRSVGVCNGAIVDITAVANAIIHAVADAKTPAFSGDIRRVVASVSGKQIASLNSTSVIAVTRATRRITADDLVRASEQAKIIVLPPDREIVHCIPRSYKVDGQDGVRHPEGMFGNRVELDSHIVTTTFSHMQNVEAAVHQAGLELVSAVVSSIASSEAVLYPEERKLGVMVVDIGEGSSDIAIFMDGAIAYTAVVPVGAGQITDDLCAAFRIDSEDAERIKLLYGDYSIDSVEPGESDSYFVTEVGTGVKRHLSTLDLAEIIESRMEELFSLIRNELIKSGCYNLLPAGTVITGGGAKLCGASSLCAKILKTPVRLGVLQSFDIVPPELCRLEYATGIGLTLHAASNPASPISRTYNGLKDTLGRVKSLFSRFSRLSNQTE